ncbi:aspartyl protease family protein 2-like [Oryza glaberrima]|uniref:Peptidase A1 domain-containing protein n=1 Tax=Oryza glaberrima TaxID=4538 RepID=I1NRA2_ORYGL|nr:aspartyl protease family protein 2-like [Oryza glaberrima]
MAPLKTLLLFLVVLLPVANACQPPRTLHVPVFHRDALFPPPPGAKRGSLLRQRLAADAARYASLVDATGRLHSPVFSGIPFESGEYFALVGVGTPSTKAMLVIDTGSDLVWLQCSPCRRCYAQRGQVFDPRRSSTYRRVPCSSPQCRALRFPGCDSGGAAGGGCRYMVAYGDGSSSTGDLATDKLAFANDTYVNNVTLGCGRDNEGLFDSAAGLLGVGRGKISISTQVAPAYGSVFEYCLGDRTSRSTRSSYLVFGRTPEPPSTAFTALLSNPRRPSLYYVDMAGFSVGGERVTGFSNASLALDTATGRGGVVVDSGTAISRFARDAYAALRDAFDARARAAGMRRLAGEHSVFDACYDLRGRPAASAPLIVLHFAGGADMALPPENYFLPVDGGRRRAASYRRCLGFEAADDGLSVIGNVQQQGFRVVFDVEKERIGFALKGCTS